ncbi:hypothetical protein ACJWDR_37580 [Streptomyces tauricus]|uniref:hypothetical protein n=1 Tax=Streptomyces tauricus TaxID=68274 RepID=UPI00387EEA89
MKLWRRRTPAPVPPRASPTRIAVLEHDLLGVPPEPGTAAALVIGMRRTGTCLEHEPVETAELGEPVRNGLCTRCGAALLLSDEGAWATATT